MNFSRFLAFVAIYWTFQNFLSKIGIFFWQFMTAEKAKMTAEKAKKWTAERGTESAVLDRGKPQG